MSCGGLACRPRAMPARRLSYSFIMTDERKALHDQVEQVREEDIDHLVDFINRFLNPSEWSGTSAGIVFHPVPPGSKAAAEIEKQRPHAQSQFRAKQSEMIARSIGDAVTRLGIDLDNIAEASYGSSTLRGKLVDFSSSWFVGRVFNRLSMFYLKEQQVVTFERCHISETQSELIYKVRVLTPIADLRKN